jgi:predicted PurR-regulated permease PerM
LKKFRWDKRYLHWGVTAFLVIVASITVYLAFSHWRTGAAVIERVLGALMPVLYGGVFAYLLNKLLVFFERLFLKRLCRRLCRRHPERAARVTRALAVLLSLCVALAAIGGILAILLPSLYESLESVVLRLPGYFRTVIAWIERTLADNAELEAILVRIIGNVENRLTDWLQSQILEQANTIISNLTGGVIGVARELAHILVGIVVSVYVLYHKEKFAVQSRKLLCSAFKKRAAETILRGAWFVDRTCGGFISSKLVDSLIVGAVCYVFLRIVNMPYAALVSVLIGVTNLIPFFGPFIGGVPSGLLILLESPQKCLVFIIFIVILQQIDGNILYPRLQGGKLGLSGFWILFAILLFGGLFGFWGFLLGVPVFTVIYEGARLLINARLRARGLPEETEAYADLGRVMERETAETAGETDDQKSD